MLNRILKISQKKLIFILVFYTLISIKLIGRYGTNVYLRQSTTFYWY
jgi:hypothetical protein